MRQPFTFETYYERLARKVAAKTTDELAAELQWLHAYNAMSDRRRRKLWKGYDRVVKRSIDTAEGKVWRVLHAPLAVG